MYVHVNRTWSLETESCHSQPPALWISSEMWRYV